MTLTGNGGTSLRRIVRDHRRLVTAIVVVLLANVIVYAAVVYPLERRVGNVTERTQAAESELLAARNVHTQATGTLTGKTRASEELGRFYTEILPADLASARRLTFARLDQLARQNNLRPSGYSAQVERERNATLVRLGIEMTLTGPYTGIRRFIHQLEQATEFVAIERVALREEFNQEAVLTVQLELSTYFREPQP